MGMFDDIQVPANILPAIPDFVTLGEFFDAQTRSLGRSMDSYKIKNGKLYKFFYDEIQVGEEERDFGPIKMMWPITVGENERWNLVEHHGIICFYNSYNDWWMEYEAYFSYGKLDKIIHLPFKKVRQFC